MPDANDAEYFKALEELLKATEAHHAQVKRDGETARAALAALAATLRRDFEANLHVQIKERLGEATTKVDELLARIDSVDPDPRKAAKLLGETEALARRLSARLVEGEALATSLAGYRTRLDGMIRELSGFVGKDGSLATAIDERLRAATSPLETRIAAIERSLASSPPRIAPAIDSPPPTSVRHLPTIPLPARLAPTTGSPPPAPPAPPAEAGPIGMATKKAGRPVTIWSLSSNLALSKGDVAQALGIDAVTLNQVWEKVLDASEQIRVREKMVRFKSRASW